MIDDLDEPMPTLQGEWMPEDEHSDGREMTLRTALRTSSNRAAVRLLRAGRHATDRRLRQEARRRLGAERAVARAGLRRGDAGGDDGGVRRRSRIRASYHTPMLIRRVEDREGAVIFDADRTATRVVSERRRSCSPAC